MSGRLDRLVDIGYGAGWSLVKALPQGLATRSFTAAADVAFRRRGPSVVQLARNLHRVLGPDATPAELAAVTQAAMRSYARYWQETFRLPAMDPQAVIASQYPTLKGAADLVTTIEAGRGVVLALPHSGNWDAAGLTMASLCGGLTTVAERLKPESLFDKFVDYRQGLGMEVLPLTGGANPTPVLKQRLAAGKLVCLVADRDLSGNGITVDFFGEPARMPAGPAMLAALTGAELRPTHLYYTEHGWAGWISDPIPLPGTRLRDQVTAGTQQVARFFEQQIALHPADWHMLQPFWEADLPDRSGTAAAATSAATPR